MNLRWYEDAEGNLTLQEFTDVYSEGMKKLWQDVPTVKAPHKAREFWVSEDGNQVMTGNHFIFGKTQPLDRTWIKVREVIDSPEAISDAEGLKK
jgi:hypothetical protein